MKIDLDSGADELFALYNTDDHPRNIAIRDDGAIFASLHGGSQNVVRLELPPGESLYRPVSFSPSIGGFGPGQLDFHDNDVYVAGDAARYIFRYDGASGAEVDQFSVTASNNIRAMAISGDTLYYAEIFQNTVRTFDLSAAPPVGGTLFANSPQLNEPLGMAIGHNGNLFLTCRQNSLIQEFDAVSGAFVGTLANIADVEPGTNNNMITYSAELDRYFVTTGTNRVHVYADDGTWLRTYESDLLDIALGVAVVVPEPSTAALAGCCVWLALAGRRVLRPA